jgi:hypothetical protein
LGSKKVNSKTTSGAAKDDDNPFKVDPNFFDELDEKRKAFENGAKHQLFDTNEPVIAPTKATVAAAKKLVEGHPAAGPLHQNWMEDPELEGDSKDDETPVKKKRKNRRKKNRRKKKENEAGQDDEANDENTDSKDKNADVKADKDSTGPNGQGDCAQEDGVHLFSGDGVTANCQSDADFEEYLKHFELRLSRRWPTESYCQPPSFAVSNIKVQVK